MVNWTPFIVRFLGYRCKLLHVTDITIMHVSLWLSQTRSLSTVQFDGVLLVCNVFLDQKYKFQITRDSNIFLLDVPPSPWLSILRFNRSWVINAWTQIQILRWMIKQTGAECFFFAYQKGVKDLSATLSVLMLIDVDIILSKRTLHCCFLSFLPCGKRSWNVTVIPLFPWRDG